MALLGREVAAHGAAFASARAEFYPEEVGETDALREALQRLQQTDPALSVAAAQSPALGAGFSLGFLGALHMEVVQQRYFPRRNLPPLQIPQP